MRDTPFTPGEKDSLGNTVVGVFSYEPGKYIIYEIQDCNVVVDGPTFDEVQKDDGINEALMDVARLQIQSPGLKARYKTKIAHAFRIIMDGNRKSGKKQLENIRDEMEAVLRHPARFAYQGGALLAALVPGVLFFTVQRIAPVAEFGTKVFYAVIFASLGGYLSVLLGSRQIDVEIMSGPLSNAVYGGMRIAISCACGVIMLLLIKSDLLLGPLRNTDAPETFYLACLTAGFSERLVPNLLKKLQASEKS